MNFLKIFFAIILMNAFSTNVEAQIAGVEWKHLPYAVCYDDRVGDLNKLNPKDSYEQFCLWVSAEVHVYSDGEVNPVIHSLDRNSSQFYGYSLQYFKDQNKLLIQHLASQFILYKILYGSFQDNNQEQSNIASYDREQMGKKCIDISSFFEDHPDISDAEDISACFTVYPMSRIQFPRFQT